MKTRLLGLSAAIALAYGFTVAPVLAAAPKEIDGVVNDTLGHPLPDAIVNLKAADGHVVGTTRSDRQGHFTFTNIAPGTYAIAVDKATFEPGTGIVNLAPENGAATTITLASKEAIEIRVAAQRLNRARNGISVETGSSVYRMDRHDIAALPQGEETPFNQVLLRAPGVAQDSFGQLHVRGDHANLQYRLNGIVLPEAISGFGQTLDTRFVDSVNLLTGALPAQYGYRTAGVVDIHTKTGELETGGNIGLQLGSHNTRELSADVSGSKDAFSYYLNGSFLKNNLGIENPTDASSAMHDQTLQSKAFGYFSYLLSPSSRVSVILANADSRFQIPTVPGQTPSFQLDGVTDFPSTNVDERQRETNRYGIVAYQATLSDKIDYQIAAFSRYTKVLFEPDPVGDLLYTGVAARVLRSGLANGVQADVSYKWNDRHTVRTGVFYTREELDNSNHALTFPADADGNQLATQPIAIVDDNQKTTHLTGLYLQDEWKVNDKLTVNYGARADWVSAYVSDSQLSPRLGLVYQVSPQTTLHAGYAKYFTPPPSELIASTTIAAFQNTTNAQPTAQNDPVKAESADYFDLGVSHQINRNLTLGVDAYYKNVNNLLDEGQFGSALVFTPFNYRKGKIYGVELTANYRKDNFSAYASLARATALGKEIVSSQYNFEQDELDYIATHWVHLDHDQSLSASAGASYQWQGTIYSADAIFGSGLRRDFANTDHLPAYTSVNVAATHTFDDTPAGKLTGRLSVINLLDRTYEIRDGSGVGVGAPQFGQRRSFYVSLSKSF